ncbi:MAG TPA: class I SAM-dependent methyltransferase [Streptosporangiaceae bacterium]|jgi:SAM-dependent methyltransferase|nr:class I SAM-dependent methyltransferase [Streptosporangiaceae bacterium]
MTGDSSSFGAHATSFGVAAATYERGRPPYPPEALDWLLPPGAQRVLDLGAGTGKLTRQLVARGLDVVAVEPLEGMRAELSRVLPGTPVLDGSAEQIPLPDGAVDAVLAAQAWHWVTPERAAPEVARVLRPGGALGLVWNERDDQEPWVAALNQIVEDHGNKLAADELRAHNDHDNPQVGPPFGPLELHQVRWVHETSLPELLDMIASRSYVILLPPGQRETLLAQVRQLAGTDPALAGRATFPLPYLTWCWRARRP